MELSSKDKQEFVNHNDQNSNEIIPGDDDLKTPIKDPYKVDSKLSGNKTLQSQEKRNEYVNEDFKPLEKNNSLPPQKHLTTQFNRNTPESEFQDSLG